MAKKNKKVSITKIDEAIKNNCESVKTVEWYGLEIEIKPVLDMNEMLSFVTNVVNACYDQETGYSPEAEGFIVRYEMFEKYTNIALPEKLSHAYDIVYNSELYWLIRDNIDDNQFHDIISAAYEKIRYLRDSDVSEIQRATDKLSSTLEDIQDSTDSLFNNITQEDIDKLADIVGGGVNEEKLVKAYMNEKYGEDS